MYTTENVIFLGVVSLPLLIVLNLIRRKSVFYHLVSAAVWIYLVGVIAVTLAPFIVDSRVIESNKHMGGAVSFNFIPLKSIKGAFDRSYFGMRNLIGNILLLLPFGVLAGSKRNIRIYKMVLIGVAASVFIEALQFLLASSYVIQRRSVDIDDVILNSCGYLFGCLAALIGKRAFLKKSVLSQ
ncbi:hypothetical protein E5161_12735 [Cohnella pontilimi]|uniref:VanZ-like domain-containing protein n=1 Tax=Cohnella pontilimi TaxID=2564100 RepID=A0A4U0F9I0_9BACL|nr:VanZ family protein [Cohnella pontilimi]TJY41291.1 hypothetical protein E5161_12735 [Cohnella pontilimi]